MNKSISTLKREMQSLEKLDRHFSMDVNSVKFSKANSRAHELAKAEVCYELLQRGESFVTEARFSDGTRADIYSISADEVWEIETNQTPSNLARKKALYNVSRVNIIDPKRSIRDQM